MKPIIPFLLPKPAMFPQAFEKLQVLVTGVDAAIARDVVQLIVCEGASVTAADNDAAKLARLDRDLGLFRTTVETAQIDLANASEMRFWEASLSGLGRLPHVMICCCACAAQRRSRKRGATKDAQLTDVALSEHRGRNCPGLVAARVLQPALFLHAEPLRQSALDRALAAIRHPTLREVLARAPGRGVFSPDGRVPYVRIASHVYSIRRPFDGEPAKRARLRLVPPTDRPPGRADAA